MGRRAAHFTLAQGLELIWLVKGWPQPTCINCGISGTTHRQGKGDSFILARIFWTHSGSASQIPGSSLRCRFDSYNWCPHLPSESRLPLRSHSVRGPLFMGLESYYIPYLPAPACGLLDRNFLLLFNGPPQQWRDVINPKFSITYIASWLLI